MPMTAPPRRTPVPGSLRTFLVAWTSVCIVLGSLAAWQVLELRTSADSMDAVGRSLQRTGSSLGALSDLPLVGKGVEDAAASVEGGGDTVRDSAAQMHTTILALAIIVWVAIAVLPTVPLLVSWWMLTARSRHPDHAP